jgi:FkbM family methyltransferase
VAVSAWLGRLRRTAGAIKRHVAPTPEVAAWRHACRLAARTPRHTPGRIALAAYSVAYTDLLTLCPQWYDIFVERSLAFHADLPAPRILDCGANVGLASLFFKRCYPQARITAFEADPTIAAVLASNLRHNGAADVSVVAAAVWTETGSLTFNADGADGGSIASTHDAAARAIQVSAVRLRDHLASGAIDLLKLDIEGAEADVLEDCVGALENVRALLLEVHEVDPDRRRCPDILRLLEREGFAYAVTHVTPLPHRQPGGRHDGPFPHRSEVWVEAVSAWRRDSR